MNLKPLTVEELCRFLHTLPGDVVVHVPEHSTDDREYVDVHYDQYEKIVWIG
jgi:hypothetical protein